jgi:preprotein translocase subunit SecE
MARATEGATGSALSKPVRMPEARSGRAAPERRPLRLWSVTVQFLQDVRAEMNRVVWPERKMVIASTLVVVFVMVVTALYLAGWDWVLAYIFKQVLKF